MFGALFHSFVLAQVFGLYFVFLAIILVSRASYYRELAGRMDPFDPAVTIAAAYGLLLGIFLVVIHNLWVWEPRVIVTIIAWIIMIKSILWLSFPVRMVAWYKRMYSGSGLYILSLILFVIGVILLIKGFYFAIPEEHAYYTLFSI